MNARTATAVLALLAALTLSGCAGTADPTGDERTAPAASESDAPLTAETAEPETESAGSPDDQYLTDVRTALTNGRETAIPNATDEQLLQAGRDACEQIAAGTPESEIHVVDGEQPDELLGEYPESYIIATVAQGRIC